MNLLQSLHSSVGFMSSIINLAVCIGEKTARISAGGGEICPIIAIITVGDMGEPISTPLLVSSGSVSAAVDGSGGGGGGGRPMCAIDVGDPTSSRLPLVCLTAVLPPPPRKNRVRSLLPCGVVCKEKYVHPGVKIM